MEIKIPDIGRWAHFNVKLLYFFFQVFYPGVKKAVFFVASRGHHADIGGITPGSMPPHSRHINEEGAVFRSFYLVKNGVFQEEGIGIEGLKMCTCLVQKTASF